MPLDALADEMVQVADHRAWERDNRNGVVVGMTIADRAQVRAGGIPELALVLGEFSVGLFGWHGIVGQEAPGT
jgi:hypothetical protein